MPGFNGNHWLSIFGDAGKAVLSKLIADPGPQSSWAFGGAVVVAGGDDVPGAEVVGGWDEPGVPHDATVDIAKNSVKTAPRADRPLCGWNISVVFRELE
jgi:hypothetical protein